jgi:hypothetical protein
MGYIPRYPRVRSQDSRSGSSAGFLVEGGIGPFSLGQEESWSIPNGTREGTTLFMVGAGDHAGGFVSFGNTNSPVQVGGYLSAFGRGAGAYVNLVPGGGCAK